MELFYAKSKKQQSELAKCNECDAEVPRGGQSVSSYNTTNYGTHSRKHTPHTHTERDLRASPRWPGPNGSVTGPFGSMCIQSELREDAALRWCCMLYITIFTSPRWPGPNGSLTGPFGSMCIHYSQIYVAVVLQAVYVLFSQFYFSPCAFAS